MKKSTVFWIVAAIVLIAAGGALFTGALAKAGWDFSSIANVKFEDETVPVNRPFKHISVKAGTETITFLPSEGRTCSVEFRVPEQIRREVTITDDTLRIETEDTRSWHERLGLFSFEKGSIKVYLPVGEYGALTAATTTGGIELPEHFGFSQISLTASTGDVTCRADAGEGLTIALSTGDIRLEGINAGNVSLSLTTGKIEIADVTCRDLLISQSTGRSKIQNVTCSSLSSTASTGRIALENVCANQKISVERTTGDITLSGCDAGELFLKTTTGDVSGTLRTEKTFFTETNTGRVDVPKTLSNFACEVHTTTGDITFTVEP